MLALRLASRMTARRASSRRLSVPSVMKAAVVREPGAADALKVESDFPVPDIAAGQVLVKNAFAGINFIDTYHRSGCMPATYRSSAARRAAARLSPSAVT